MNDFNLDELTIHRLCEHTGVTGVAVAVVRDGQLVYTQATGKLSVDAIIPVASLSKPVFAYAVLKLIEQGILDLDRPLMEYLSEPYLSNEPLLPFITARHALSHTTGFPNWRKETGWRAAFQPGSAFHYSTEGLIYLQTVVETLVKKPIHEILQAYIFDPFGMQASRFVPEDLSTFLSYLPQGLRAYGAISLHTTVLDYARFMIEMMSQGDGVGFRLSSAGRDKMLTPQVQVGVQNGLSWGLGWGMQNITGKGDSFWHWGARRNLTCCFAMGECESRSGIIIFTDHEDGLTVCEQIAQIGLSWPVPIPAFHWLLPAEKWRADGLE
jgi:CubicO group peptidase (beta-lactamase class C family)